MPDYPTSLSTVPPRWTTSAGIRFGWAVVCCVLAYLRLTGVMDNRFQALAHLVVGGLLGAWALGLVTQRRYQVRVAPGVYGWLALAVSLVEVYAFLAGIGKLDGKQG
jgi:NADH:ubiquinone oxidoreductase subunit K